VIGDDVLATRGADRIYIEAEGRAISIGLDVDAMYGQLLRRVSAEEMGTATFASVALGVAVEAALRVPQRVGGVLRIPDYGLPKSGIVAHYGHALDPIAD